MRARTDQHGYALLLTLLAILVGTTSIVLTYYRPRGDAAVIDDRTLDTFNAVKAALIGYAAAQGGPTGTARPGNLPCPDTDNDGLENAPCTTETLGRVPWRTIDIPEPKDSVGETLWYRVSNAFLSTASNPGSKINSNTVGNLTVRAPDGVTPVTTIAAAVIFSPGLAVGNQSRGSAAAFCSPGKPNLASNLCPANYLDTALGVDNSANSGVFVAGTKTASFNDRLVYILPSEIIPVLEMRVGREFKTLLIQYRARSDCQCFPWADSWVYSGGIGDIGTNRGRFPTTAYPEGWGPGNPRMPTLPAWMGANDWNNLVFYSAARQETDGGGTKCVYCSLNNMLSVGSDSVGALVFTPGSPAPGINRSTTHLNVLSAYLDDTQNKDADSCPGTAQENSNNILNLVVTVPANCDVYARPTSRTQDRDRVHTLVASEWATCDVAAPALAAVVQDNPCHTTGNNVSLACTNLSNALKQCSCSAAGQEMIDEPCRNTLNPGQCQTALANLKTCKN